MKAARRPRSELETSEAEEGRIRIDGCRYPSAQDMEARTVGRESYLVGVDESLSSSLGTDGKSRISRRQWQKELISKAGTRYFEQVECRDRKSVV